MSAVTDYFSRGITSLFGDGRGGGRRHRGTDFSHGGNRWVPSLLDGVVVGKLSPADWHGFGYQVTIRSTVGGRTYDFSYAHGLKASALPMGARVKAGDLIIQEGRSGWTTGACCHVELYTGGQFVDPLPTIRKIVSGEIGGGSSAGGGGIPFNAHDLWVQQSLNKLGFGPLEEDGKRGTATIAAVKRYQGANGLVRDGIPGSATTAELKRDLAAQTPAPSGLNYLNGWAWGGIQKMLKSEYGYTGAIDSIPGKGTWVAMQKFLKRHHGYTGAIDGLPGSGSISALAGWLRKRWGYSGNDVPGPVMQAAFARASAENAKAF